MARGSLAAHASRCGKAHVRPIMSVFATRRTLQGSHRLWSKTLGDHLVPQGDEQEPRTSPAEGRRYQIPSHKSTPEGETIRFSLQHPPFLPAFLSMSNECLGVHSIHPVYRDADIVQTTLCPCVKIVRLQIGPHRMHPAAPFVDRHF
jgi:hypothetical protein